MVYDMNLGAINDMELYIFGKRKSSAYILSKAGISYTKGKRGTIYNKEELWEYFNKDPKHQEILQKMNIHSLDEMAYVSFNRKLDENIPNRVQNEDEIKDYE